MGTITQRAGIAVYPRHALAILLADDEPDVLDDIGSVLRAEGHRVVTARDGGQALALVRSWPFELVITDVRLPAVDGLEILRRVRAEAPGTDVVLMSGYACVPDAVAAWKGEAADYLSKPFDPQSLLSLVDAITQRRRLRADAARARATVAGTYGGPQMIGQSAVMVRLRERLAAFAMNDAPLLLLGESGTGKELAARLTHALGPRANGPFVTLNCAASPEGLLEAELFGHVRGGLGGASRDRKGRIAGAQGGTLFLDDVAELSLPAQARLLRVLEEGTSSPPGRGAASTVDVRLISATHQDLRQAIADGRFREDLYLRIKVLDTHLPPLARRAGDVPLLVEHFLRLFAAPGREPARVSPRAWAALAHHPYRGNVRELEHAIRYALVLSRGGEIGVEHLPDDIRGPAVPTPGDTGPLTLGMAVAGFEREYIVRTLLLAGGKRARAAELLGISRKHLWQKIRDHQITDDEIGAD